MRVLWCIVAAGVACKGSDKDVPAPPAAGSATAANRAAGTAAPAPELALVGCAPAVEPPSVYLGSGTLGKAEIRRVILRNLTRIRYCYEKRMLAKPGLAGTVTAHFFITADGTVEAAQAKGMDPEVADCIAATIEAARFPVPRNGAVEVNYPFTFRPDTADDRDEPPPGIDESGGTGTMALDEPRPSRHGAATAAGSANDQALARQQAIEQARQAGILGSASQPPASLPSDRDGWTPFAADPIEPDDARAKAAAGQLATALAARLDELATCVPAAIANGSIRAMVRVGVGGVERSRVGGLGDETAEGCIDTKLHGVKVAGVPADSGAATVEVACDLQRGAGAPWLLTRGPFTRYATLSPHDSLAAIDAAPDGPFSTVVAVALDDDSLRYLGLTPRGDATRSVAIRVDVAPGTARFEVLDWVLDHVSTKDVAALDAAFAQARAACAKTAACHGTVAITGAGPAGDALAIADAAKRAKLERVAIGSP